jgi:3-keto-disaccharide hydrolase
MTRPNSLFGVRTPIAGLAILIALTTALTARQAPAPLAASSPSSTIKLFDGRSLGNFQTWLVDHHEADPERVFSVVDQVDGAPAIRISGQVWGGLLTKEAYRDYRLVAEFRWGGATWGDRKTRARDSGVLLHAQGRLGNTKSDFNGPWLRSIEFQIIEGGVGDILPVSGFGDAGEQIRPAVTARVRKDRDGETVYDATGMPQAFSSGRINWWGRSEDWADRLGFRGPQDVESAGLEWTRIEAVVEKDTLKYYVNGKLVNEAAGLSVSDGKIMIQSEGAEIYFRRIDLEPLK